MTREALRQACTAALAANDRNGVFTDEDCKLEGCDPMTLADIREIVTRMAESDEISPRDMGALIGVPAQIWEVE